jgi:hypothetical protein
MVVVPSGSSPELAVTGSALHVVVLPVGREDGADVAEPERAVAVSEGAEVGVDVAG